MSLSRFELLDPRREQEAAERPIARAVNIPFDALAQRVHELPPRAFVVRVADVGEASRRAVEWLRGAERRVELAPVPDDAVPAGAPLRGRLWEPNLFLQQVVANARPGRALDLACGAGREAVYLKSLGWRVLAVDLLPDALVRGRALEGRYAPGPHAVDWRRLNLESDDRLPAGPFDLICVFRFLHRPLLRRLAPLLGSGGGLVLETFSPLHRDRHGRPRRESLTLRPEEAPELLAGLRIEHCSAEWRGEAHTVRTLARKGSTGD